MSWIPVLADVIAATPGEIIGSTVRPWVPVILVVIAVAAAAAVIVRRKRK